VCGANLSGAGLRGVDFRGANLSGAGLRGVDFRGAGLRGVDFREADLSVANFRRADLSGADLRGADLSGANLCGADLSGANLCGAKNAKLSLSQFKICPEEGSFIAWKKCSDGVVAKLEIPSDSKRVNAISSRKCRAEFVKTIALYGKNNITEIRGKYDSSTIYRAGEITRADSFNDSVLIECSRGIHFFLTRQEAEDYI
jgi:hypothetical protein